MKEYTHLAKIYGFYCYFNIHTAAVKGTNWFRDIAIDICIWLDVTFEISDGFYIELIEEL